MIKKLPFLLFFLAISGLCRSQGMAPYSFFKGDTLQGFDMQIAFSQASLEVAEHHLSSRELKVVLYRKEKAFVLNKYHLVPKPRAAALQSGNISVLASACSNVDFENGNFTGWVGAVGYNDNTSLPMTIVTNGVNTLGLDAPETSCSYHTLVDAAAGNDPYSGLPMLDPGGGNFAVRLGSENMNVLSYFSGPGTCGAGDTSISGLGGSGGELLEQTFLITPNNNLFTYNYSVVMDQVSHLNGEQPYFRIEVLDSSGAQTKVCDQYYVQEDSTGAAPKGFITSPVLQGGFDTVYYLPWTSNSINLTPYMGKKVTVRFTAAGCIYGGHFAYAYVDCSCSPLHLNLAGTTACTGSATTISAPPGAPGYQWTKVPPGPGIVGSSTNATCQINQSGKYQVTITHGACNYIIDTTLTFLPVPVYTSLLTNGKCDTLASGSAAVTVTGGIAPFIYSWSTTPPQSTASINNLPPGSYTISVTSANGCSTDTVLTIINPPKPVASFNAAPNPVFISAPEVTFTNSSTGAVSWSWQFGDSAKSVSILQNPRFTYADTGCFLVTLVAANSSACKDTARSKVCVQSEFEFYAPNSFTPNGDGLNDIWMPVGQDIDPFSYDLTIFNRWGNLVFESTTPGKGWDGTGSGNSNSQVDTYVWHVALKDQHGHRYIYTGNLNLIR